MKQITFQGHAVFPGTTYFFGVYIVDKYVMFSQGGAWEECLTNNRTLVQKGMGKDISQLLLKGITKVGKKQHICSPLLNKNVLSIFLLFLAPLPFTQIGTAI